MALCEALPRWLCEFPALPADSLRTLRQTVDGAFREAVRAAADTIDALTAPLMAALGWFERLLTGAPWVLVMAALLGLVAAASRSARLTLAAGAGMAAIGWVGLWEDAMVTLAMVAVATLLAIILGLPLGILSARSDGLRRVLVPVLDLMQTLPSFVYLIPVVVIFGIGRVPGLIAVTAYALPPLIRMTDFGLRSVGRDLREAAAGLGASDRQRLFWVDLPVALPAIMAGVNQTIMMALAMVVVASMVGVGGLGRNVLQAINNQFFTAGALNGLALVIIAIVFDRTARALGRRFDPAGAARADRLRGG